MRVLLIGLIGMAVFVSLSGLFYQIHQDEAVFMEIGSAMHEGKLPYRDFKDFKPPGIDVVWYLVLSIRYLVSDRKWLDVGSLYLIRFLVMVVNWVSAGLIYLIYIKNPSYAKASAGRQKPNIKYTNQKSKRTRKESFTKNYFMSRKTLGLICGVSYLVLGQVYQGQFGLTEPFMVMWLLIAVCLLGEFRIQNSGVGRKEWLFVFLAGVALGMAMVFKQSAVLSLLAVGLWLIVFGGGRNVWMEVVMLILGMGMVWMPVVSWLMRKGILVDFWRVAVVYPVADYPPQWRETVKALPKILGPAAVVWGGVIFFLIRRILGRENKESRDGGFSGNTRLLWLMMLMPLPVVLTRPYHHYWLQILPWAILLVADGLWRSKWGRYLWLGNVGIAGMVLLGPGLLVG